MKVIDLHTNLEQLIAKACEDNRRAQEQLYAMFSPKMLSICRQYIKVTDRAEEVMLSGFFKAFKNLKQFTGAGSFEGWLRRIMTRECISFLRKEKKIYFEDEASIDATEQHANYLETSLDLDRIQQLIDGLPSGYRIVFVMYAIEGYKHAEIATHLKISESTSKTQLFKARKMLQKQLKTLNNTSYGTT